MVQTFILALGRQRQVDLRSLRLASRETLSQRQTERVCTAAQAGLEPEMISLPPSVNADLTGECLSLTLHVSSKGNAFWTPRPALKVGSGSLPTVQPGSTGPVSGLSPAGLWS